MAYHNSCRAITCSVPLIYLISLFLFLAQNTNNKTVKYHMNRSNTYLIKIFITKKLENRTKVTTASLSVQYVNYLIEPVNVITIGTFRASVRDKLSRLTGPVVRVRGIECACAPGRYIFL